jgi:hypothetical protein
MRGDGWESVGAIVERMGLRDTREGFGDAITGGSGEQGSADVDAPGALEGQLAGERPRFDVIAAPLGFDAGRGFDFSPLPVEHPNAAVLAGCPWHGACSPIEYPSCARIAYALNAYSIGILRLRRQGGSLPAGRDADNLAWDQQLRGIIAAWFGHAVRISGRSEASLAREAGIETSTVQRMKKQQMTMGGANVDALAKAAGVPGPLLLDVRDYAALYAAQHPRPASAARAAVAEQARLDALVPEPDQPAEAPPTKRQGRGGKG